MAVLETEAAASEDAVVHHAPVAAPRIAGWLHRNWPLLALGLGALVVTVVSRFAIYPAFSWNRDEATYLWQTELLQTGRIFAPHGGDPASFWPWLAGLRGGGFFSQYTIGWPAALAASDWVFGSPTFALAFSTVIAVLGTYAFAREVTRDRSIALVSATVMLASPVVVIQSGTYLAYLFSLGLGLFFATALLAGFRRDNPWLVMAAAALLGSILLTRPYDAVLWAVPVLGYVAFVYRDRWAELLRALVPFGVVMLPFVAFTLLYNRRVTGSFTEFPITAKEPLDTFGFGQRRLMPIGDIFDYNLTRAMRSVAHNTRMTPPFLIGWWMGAVVALVGLWLRRRDRTTLLLLGIGAVFPVGYFLFWGNLLSSRAAGISAPIYYVPAYAPLCILVATVVVALWRYRRGLAVAVCVGLAAATIPTLVHKIDVNHRISEAQEPWQYATRPIRDRALAIIENSGPYLMHLNPYSRNDPDLEGRILYAVDRGKHNFDVIGNHPLRTPYLLRTSDPLWDDPVGYNEAPVPTVTLHPIQVVVGRTLTLRVRVTDPEGPAVVMYFSVNRNGIGLTGPKESYEERRVLATDAPRGASFETEWTLPAAGPGSPFTDRTGVISIGVASGRTPDAALIRRREVVEYFYRVDESQGTVETMRPHRDFVARFERQRGRRQLVLRPVDGLRGLDVQLTMER